MIYVLIMVFSGGFGGASSTAEFSSKAACEQAAEVIKRRAPADNVLALCFSKAIETPLNLKDIGKVQ